MFGDVRKVEIYTGLIPDLFISGDEAVIASSMKEAEILMVQNLRKKLNELSDQEIIYYLGIIASVK
jgi:cytochrome c-type biogenesis protein CcmE